MSFGTRRAGAWIAALLFLTGAAAPLAAQTNVFNEVMSGSMVNPEVGLFAWYDVTDTASGTSFFLRQAIVGKEKVGRSQGYWLETEVVPQIGFPLVYKMLLTGPASDVANIHKIIMRDGPEPPEQMKPDSSMASAMGGGLGEGSRKVLGTEEVATPQGPIQAEHVVIERDGQKTEVWTSDQVRPMGVVRLVSPEGELKLRHYGSGGPDAESAIDRKYPVPSGSEDTKVEVNVKQGAATGPAPQPPTNPASQTPPPSGNVQKNFKKRGSGDSR